MNNTDWKNLEDITAFSNACGVYDPIRPIIFPRGHHKSLYLTLMFNLNEDSLPNEVFIKIGCTENIEQRLSRIRTNSRCYTLLIRTSKFHGGMHLEEFLIKSLKKHKYEPSIPFCGASECFDPDIVRNPLIMAIFDLKFSDVNIFLNYIDTFNKTKAIYAFLPRFV